MRLELDILRVQDVQFEERTAISGGVLYINRQELGELMAEDERFSQVDIDLVHPGENCRLVQVFDVTEPRAKMGGSGENFPGILGELKTAGGGRTRVLQGTAVVTVDYTSGEHGLVIDISGPGADIGIYGQLHNIVLLCRPVDGIARYEYQNALRLAGLKAAVYLAEAGREMPADEVEVYALGPLAEAAKGMEHLPRVAYVYQIHALQQSAEQLPNEPIFYGDNVRELLPTIVHPNEILDGALVRGYFCQGQETYSIQNHPIIRELYRRHGQELCFVGVVVTVAQSTEPERVRSAAMAAELVRRVLGADGAVLTKIGGGAPHTDLGQTCEACEQMGVKTAIMVADMSTDGSSEGALLFNTPYADAIVSVGAFCETLVLPPVDRVIGGPVVFGGDMPAEGELKLMANRLGGPLNQLGALRVMEREV